MNKTLTRALVHGMPLIDATKYTSASKETIEIARIGEQMKHEYS